MVCLIFILLMVEFGIVMLENLLAILFSMLQSLVYYVCIFLVFLCNILTICIPKRLRIIVLIIIIFIVGIIIMKKF